MQPKISKRLEALIARATFNTTKAATRCALDDHLAVEMLRDEGSLAWQLLSARLKHREMVLLRRQIERETALSTRDDGTPERFYRLFVEEIVATNDDRTRLTTAHALRLVITRKRSLAATLLERHGITAEVIDNYLANTADSEDMHTVLPVRMLDYADSRQRDNRRERLIDKFGTDLTLLAREGRIDPVIGREREIGRVAQILSRRKKNNPILVGEAGVGKSAIVEGLALRIASGEVPYTIADKRIFSLDVAAVVAGTKFRGEFEERMQQIIEEVERDGDTILFIDEIHTIVGAGSSQGSLDTANILKPALARGTLRTIGATTMDEYRTSIEADAALERRFSRVAVEPTSTETTLQILRNIAPHYERHHCVTYSDEALQACVALTERYITDRNFPDKAIDLLDEAGSRAHLHTARTPEPICALQQALSAAERDRRDAVAEATYERAVAARLRELALRSKIDESRHEWQAGNAGRPTHVSANDIRAVITEMTGIPTERITDDEQSRLAALHDHLASRVIGQSEAVERIARTIRHARTGLRDENRPMGVFMFVGPTGVGKTLLAKELSKWLFDERRGLIRIDMSEYAEKHNVARLIGSPPGYVGYGEGGQLTEAVRRRPYAVVLLDEIEKAHPEVFNVMLQLFDEGHLTDGSGRRVDFRNTVIIMTSNAGTRNAARRPAPVGFTARRTAAESATDEATEYRKALEEHFSPEFLNRIDDIVIFRTLTREDVERIVELELSLLRSRTEKLGFGIKITGAARRHLAAMGYQMRYGARALRRTLVEHVEEPLSNLIVDGQLCDGGTVVVESDRNGGVRLRVA